MKRTTKRDLECLAKLVFPHEGGIENCGKGKTKERLYHWLILKISTQIGYAILAGDTHEVERLSGIRQQIWDSLEIPAGMRLPDC